MQKLSKTIIEKMAKANLTNAEIDFMLYLSRIQDKHGHIAGIYYRDICADLGISYQKFYDLKKSLVSKNIICIQQTPYYADYDIILLGNDFSDDFGAYKNKEQYINTNDALFYTDAFLSMRGKSKMLVLLLYLYVFRANSKFKYNSSWSNFLERYADMLCITKRMLRSYITEIQRDGVLKIWFVKGRIYISRVKQDAAKKQTDIFSLAKHTGKILCRRMKLDYTKQDLKDTVHLFAVQYAKQVSAKSLPLYTIMHKCMSGFKTAWEVTQKKTRQKLEPRLVHSFLLDYLNA